MNTHGVPDKPARSFALDAFGTVRRRIAMLAPKCVCK